MGSRVGWVCVVWWAAAGAAAADSVERLAARLGSHEDPLERELAALDLADLGPGAAGAASALTRALRDASPAVAQAAALALGEVGPAARSAAPELLDYTLSARDNARVFGWEALAKIDADAVVSRLEPDDPRLTEHDLKRLVRTQGRASASSLLAALRATSRDRRLAGASAISRVPRRPVVEASPPEALPEPPPGNGRFAFEEPASSRTCYEPIRETAWAPPPELIEALADMLSLGDEVEATAAASALVHFGGHSDPAWPAAAGILGGPQARWGLQVLVMLCDARPLRLADMTPALLACVRTQSSAWVRRDALWLVGRSPAAAVTAQLIASTRDPDPESRGLAVRLLHGRPGPAVPIARALVELLARDGLPPVGPAHALALGHRPGFEALTTLRELASRDPQAVAEVAVESRHDPRLDQALGEILADAAR